MNEAVQGLKIAIHHGRTDIVRSAIAALERDEVEDSNVKLDQLLNSPVTSEGTLLHMASTKGQSDIVRTLLSAGADPGVQNDQAKTSLDVAVDDTVREVYNEELLQAVAHSDIGRVCQLIAAGISVNLEDAPSSRNTPLHWAASFANRDMVQCLCNRGAAVNAISAEGTTPLHDAMAKANLDVVEELLKYGADPYIRALTGKHAGKTALELAAESAELSGLMERMKNASLTNGMSAEDDESVMMNGDLDQLNSITRSASDLNHESATLTKPVPNGILPQSAVTEVISPSSVTDVDVDSMASAMALGPPSSLVTDARLNMLWPQPLKVIQREGSPFKVNGTLCVYLAAVTDTALIQKMSTTWRQNEKYTEEMGVELHIETLMSNHVCDQPHVVCEINSRIFSKAESYTLFISQNKVKITASCLEGLQHGITTLAQLMRLCREDGVPALQIHDSPSLKERGVLFDLSKGRIPTLTCLRHYMQSLAYFKVNQVQLYTRFIVPTEQDVRWQFPYSRSSLLELDQFCRSLGITLVPVFDVSPKLTIEDLPDIYVSVQQLLACFTSTSVVCIGPRLSSILIDISEESGAGLDCEDVHRLLPIPVRLTVQLCSFVFHGAMDVLMQFPCNKTLAEYGFQADYDFPSHCKQYEEFGVPYCVMPGTAAWNSLAGCPEATVSNVFNAVHTAITHNALGMTISHWSGVGHLTHLPISWTGLLTAAGLAWNPDVHKDFLYGNLAELLNTHILDDRSKVMGQVILELGRAETYLLRCARNQAGSDNSSLPAEKGSTLYKLLSHPDDVDLENLTSDAFQKTMRHIRKCQSELMKADLGCVEGPEIVSELQLTADLMLSACRIGRALVSAGKNPNRGGYSVINPGISNLTPTNKTDLANRLLSQVETYRAVWLARSLPQGLPDSIIMLTNTLKQLVPEQGDQNLTNKTSG